LFYSPGAVEQRALSWVGCTDKDRQIYVNNLYEQYGLNKGCTIENGVFAWSTIGSSGDVGMAEPEATPEAASSSQTS